MQLSFTWAADFLLHFQIAEAARRIGTEVPQGITVGATVVCWKKSWVGFLKLNMNAVVAASTGSWSWALSVVMILASFVLLQLR